MVIDIIHLYFLLYLCSIRICRRRTGTNKTINQIWKNEKEILKGSIKNEWIY